MFAENNSESNEQNEHADGPPPSQRQSSIYIWTPLQRKRLHALRDRFWLEDRYAEDRRAIFGFRQLEFIQWLVARGYYNEDDLRSTAGVADQESNALE